MTLALSASLMTLLAADPAVLLAAAFQGAPGRRVQVLEVKQTSGRGCLIHALEPLAPPARSGVIAVTLLGEAAARPCAVKAVVRVRVFTRALITSRAVSAGAALEGAVTVLEKEQRDDTPWLETLPAGALAAQALGANTTLSPRHLRDARPQRGELVRVVVNLPGLRLDQEGRVVPCGAGVGMCARLPNGHRVEGHWQGELLEVSR